MVTASIDSEVLLEPSLIIGQRIRWDVLMIFGNNSPGLWLVMVVWVLQTRRAGTHLDGAGLARAERVKHLRVHLWTQVGRGSS